MHKISERLMMAAKMVRKGSVTADIGTDHAYLPAYLVLNGISPKALACDVRRGPLENAKKCVELYGIEDKITLRLSDGFDNIEPFEAQDFIMCGMGGTLMERLISRTPWLRDESKRLIVQPQSHAYEIREFFIKNGFDILYEDVCTDEGRLYCAMTVEFSGRLAEKPISYIYTGELPKCGKPETRLILKTTLRHLKKRLSAERLHGDGAVAEYFEKVVAEMERIIDEMQTNG